MAASLDRLVARLILYTGLAAITAALCAAPATSAAELPSVATGGGGGGGSDGGMPRLTRLRALLADSKPSGPFVLGPLPYDYSALEPVIQVRIMQLHHDVHEATYVNRLNAAMAEAASSGVKATSLTTLSAAGRNGGGDSASVANLTLPELLLQVGRGALDSKLEESVRNNGGGHWNHQLFWKVMAPPGSEDTSRSKISPELQRAIDSAFGSVDNMLSELKQAGDSRFGSGWSWLCLDGGGKLQVLSTPNQDNPLMAIVSKEPCVPILGLDVWEHAYYLQYLASRGDYTTKWLTIINWREVSANYDAAKRGELTAIGSAL